MSSRREMMAMTADELHRYLEGQGRVILVTNGADGMPHPVPMNFGLDDQGRFILTAFAKSQKVRNLEHDPRATLLVESGARYHELKAVIAWCAAEVIRDPGEVRQLMNLMRADPDLAASINPVMQDQVAASLSKRVALRFTPLRVTSWDHAKLGAAY